MGYEAALAEYQRFEFEHGSWTREVYRRGAGPAVIIIHEVPGLHPLVIRFADRVAAAGMTVFLPSLLGTPGREPSVPYIIAEMTRLLCVRREFAAWASDRSSPFTDWLRALARRVHGECGGPGVGAVGMCFSGGFALAMMTEPAVIAPVMSQPAMPLPMGRKRASALGAAPDEISCIKRRLSDEDLSVMGLRFRGDPMVPDARFEAYRGAFGDRFEGIEIDQKDGQPGPGVGMHSVLTVNLRDDDPDGPTKQAEQRVIAFLAERLVAKS
jgi:dienelactone hydrolase